MIRLRSTRSVLSIITALLLTLLLGPIVNNRFESDLTNACKTAWAENYKDLELASAELKSNYFRPLQFLSYAYSFAYPWNEVRDECFQNNPSREYIRNFVAVLKEYERQIGLGVQPIPPELPFDLLPEGDSSPHVVTTCNGWIFASKENKCKTLFKLPYSGFYRII
jgi:hypothetical protein